MTPGNVLTSRRRLQIELAVLLLIVSLIASPFAWRLFINVPFLWDYWKNHNALNPQLVVQRDELVKQAAFDFGKGFTKLGEQYQQVKNGRIWVEEHAIPTTEKYKFTQTKPAYFFVNFIGEELPLSAGHPTKGPSLSCWVLFSIHPYEWDGFFGFYQYEPFVFPNLKLKANMLHACAVDPQLDAALKHLLRDVLQPLRELDAKSGPIKAPDDLDDLHWNVLATTAPATASASTQP